MSLSESIDLVLIGKPGIGKSATGNSILGIKTFQENASSSPSVSREPVVHSSFLENKPVRVVDGLDLGVRDISIFDRQLDKAIRLLKNGFSALLIVVRSDDTFSKEEARGLEVLKDLLGRNIIQDFGICAVTYGDNFQLDVREKKVANFEDWCKRQTGDLRKLFEECRFRCVLFNNLAVERASRENLHRFVLELSEENLRQGRKRKFEMTTAKNIDKPSEIQHRGNLSSVHDGNRKLVEEHTQPYQTQKAQLQSGAVSSNEPRFDTGATSSKEPRFETRALSSNEPRFDTGAISSKEPRFYTDNLEAESEQFSRKIRSRLVEIVRLRNKEIQELAEETQRFAEKIQAQAELPSSQRFLIKFAYLEGDLRSMLQKIPLNAEHSPEGVVQTLESDELISGRAEHISGGAEQISERDEQISRKDDQISRRDEQISKQVQVVRPEERQKPTSVQTNTPSISSCNNARLDQRDDIQKKFTGQPGTDSVDLLLFGSAGNGKSSTGNCILGKEAFKVSFSTSSAGKSSTSSIVKGSAVIKGLTVNVVDGPGVHASGELNQEFLEHLMKTVEKSMELCDYGFCALLIVLQFGIRFTKQEVETIKVIKSVLGKNVIKDYGICVITHGDNFEHEVEEAAEDGETLTFESWCREQTGDVRNLFEECGFRCVLFDNKTKDAEKRLRQFGQLMSLIDRKKRYSKEEFLAAEEGLQELTVETMATQVEAETRELIAEIRRQVQQVGKDEVQDPDHYKSKLELLIRKLEAQKDQLQTFGRGASFVDMLCYQLTALEIEIRSKITQHKMMADTRNLEAASAGRMSSMMTPATSTYSAKEPSPAEMEKLQKEVASVTAQIESDLTRIDREFPHGQVPSHRLHELLGKLKECRVHAESVGKGSSSVHSILFRIASLELQIQSYFQKQPPVHQYQNPHVEPSRHERGLYPDPYPPSRVAGGGAMSYTETRMTKLEMSGSGQDSNMDVRVKKRWEKIYNWGKRQIHKIKEELSKLY